MMFFIRRNCQLALRSSNAAVVLGNGARRTFSRSSAWSRGALPTFLTPSTPELNTLLSSLNTQVFLPYHLSKEQKALVFKTKNKAKLEAEPVEITLGDVTVPLEHLDRNTLPRQYATFSAIVSGAQTPEDCENVLRMLEGFKNARGSVKVGWQTMAIRHLNLKGMQHLVIKAVQRSSATGVDLKELGVLNLVFRGLHDKAADSDWDKEQTTKAYRMATQVVELLEAPEHQGSSSRSEMVPEVDHRSNPIVIAVPTELAAVLAQRHGGDVELVRTLANRLVASLKQTDFNTHLSSIATKSAQSPSEFNTANKQINALGEIVRDSFDLLRLWYALKTSREVLGAGMPSAAEAKAVEDRSYQVLKDLVKTADGLLVKDGGQLKHAPLEALKEGFGKLQ